MDLSVVLDVLAHGANALPALAAVAVAGWLGKILFDRTGGFDVRAEIEDEPNAAFGVVYGAYFVALALGMAGALFARSQFSLWTGAAKVFGEAVIVVALLRTSLWVNDRFILYGFSIRKELRDDRNLAVAFCVAGALLATGCTLGGALAGVSDGVLAALRDTLVYWALGQAALVVGARVYRWLAPFDVHRLIELDDNTAVGLAFGGFLAGLGLILRAALVGAGTEPLGTEVLVTASFAAIGLAALLGVKLVVDLLFFRRSSVNDELSLRDNLAAGALVCGAYLGVAVAISACLSR